MIRFALPGITRIGDTDVPPRHASQLDAPPPTQLPRDVNTTRCRSGAANSMRLCDSGSMSTNSVLIVGGGPLGLLQALGLAQIGVEVTVLAPGPERQPVTRTLVFNWSMMAGLDHLGILDEMMAVGVVQHAVSLNVLRTGERIVFDLSALSADVEHAFTLNMEQGQFVDILLTHLAASSAVTIEWDTRIVSLDQGKDGCTVVAAGVDGEITRRVGWVVGADGTRSVVRRQLGLGFPGLTWPERFVAVNLRFDFSTMGIKEAATHIDPDRGALIAQIDRTGLWSYLYAENERLPEESIEARMQAVFADVLPDGAIPASSHGWPTGCISGSPTRSE